MKHADRNLIVAIGIVAALAAAILAAVFAGKSETLTDEQKLQKINDLYAEQRAAFPNIEEMTAPELQAAMAAGRVVLVDVREPAERKVSIIPGAISQERFAQENEAHESTTIVVYCTVGLRSGLYVKHLRTRGYRAVNLKGGILAWAHAGQPVANDAGPTNRVHVYSRQWDLLPAAYKAVRPRRAGRRVTK